MDQVWAHIQSMFWGVATSMGSIAAHDALLMLFGVVWVVGGLRLLRRAKRQGSADQIDRAADDRAAEVGRAPGSTPSPLPGQRAGAPVDVIRGLSVATLTTLGVLAIVVGYHCVVWGLPASFPGPMLAVAEERWWLVAVGAGVVAVAAVGLDRLEAGRDRERADDRGRA